MSRTVHNPPQVTQPVSGYSQAVCFASTGARHIHVAGQVALNADGLLVGRDDVEAQTRQTFENLEMILQTLGAGLNDIVKMTVYAVNAADHPKITAIRNEFFQYQPPASTFVAVAGLARVEWLVEVDAVAICAE